MRSMTMRALPFFLAVTGSMLAVACAPGERPPTGSGDDCGGIAGLSCEDGEFCNYPVSTQCGAGDQFGACTTIPDACTKEYRPVCGCDGETYGNACMAQAAQVSVQASGECEAREPGGNVCGGLLGGSCAKDEFCSYPESAQCGAADQTGICTRKPELCTLQYDPVCGCDDKTYGNACSAAGAGVSVAHRGECED